MPSHTATAAQLATGTRLRAATLAMSNYRKFAHAVAVHLGHFPPEGQHGNGKREPLWWMTLSSGSHEDERKESTTFTMQPALAEALDLMRRVQAHAPA